MQIKDILGYTGWRHYRNKYRNNLRVYYKAWVYELLGNKCSCCLESTEEFLSIDHKISGDSQIDHERFPSMSIDWFKYIIDLDEAGRQRKYRLLCSNCNHALGRLNNNGQCPHTRIINEVPYPC